MAIKKIYKPNNDNKFLEDIAFIVFVAGFRYDLVEKRWPLIRKAFFSFNINKLSNFNNKNIKRFMNSDGMIKNIGKIKAILENAKKCKKLQEKHGSVLNWICKSKKSYNKDPLLNPSLQEAFKRFQRIGEKTSGWLAVLHNAKGKYIEYENK